MQTSSQKPVVLVTAADLAPQALDMLSGFDVVFAGKQPTEDDVAAPARSTSRSRSSCVTAR